MGNTQAPSDRDIGASVNFYPLVGAVLGLILSAVAVSFMQVFGSVLSAALILAVWVYLTGALHIDGLADSADAWIGGLGSKERTLSLMKDPTSGPFAIVTLLLVLFVKLAAIEALLNNGHNLILVWPLVIARLSVMILFATTPNARSTGLGEAISTYLSRDKVFMICGATLLISLVMLQWLIIPSIFLASIGFVYLRLKMMKRIDGCTGDTAGALIEITEVLVLLGLVAALGLGL